MKRVFAIRKARIVAGKTGTAAGVALFVGALVSTQSINRYRAMNTYLLVGAWGALAIAGVVAWGLARRRAGFELRREPVASGDAHGDLARIDAADPLGELRSTGWKLEARSTALPLAAASLLMPLTLHGLVAAPVCWIQGTSCTAAHFGDWIVASAVFVGLAHVALLVQVVIWARSLQCRDTSLLQQNIHATWVRTLAVTAGAALVPAVVFVPDAGFLALIPVMLVLATGVAFVPLLFILTAQGLEKERAALSCSPSSCRS